MAAYALPADHGFVMIGVAVHKCGCSQTAAAAGAAPRHGAEGV
jgi:hypothetical protein